jgi:hypothetical protein
MRIIVHKYTIYDTQRLSLNLFLLFSFQQTKCRKDAAAVQAGLGDFINKVTEASEYGYDINGNR